MTGSQFNYDFGSYLRDDWTIGFDTTTEVIVNNVLKLSANNGFFCAYQASPDFSFTNGFILCVALRAGQITNAFSIEAFVKVGDKWSLVGNSNGDRDDLVNIFRFVDQGSRMCATAPGSSCGADSFSFTSWKWIALRFNQDTTIDAMYNTSTNNKIIPLPNEWTVLCSNIGSWSGGVIQEIGFRSINGSGATHDNYISKLALTTLDYDGKLAPEGLDASITFSEYYFRTALNGGGNAKFTTPNPYFPVSTTTLKAQLKKLVTFVNSYSNIAFKGEVGSIQIKFDRVEFEVEEITRKTMFTRVGFNPTIFSTFLRYWEGRSVIDKDAFWQDKGVLDTHIISFSKADVKIFATRPVAASITYVEDDLSTPYVPDNILGAGSRIYYPFDQILLNLGGDDSDQALVVVDDHPATENWAAIFPNFIFEKYQNSIESSELVLEIAYPTADDWSNDQDSGKPRIKIWDDTNSVWTEIDKLEKTDIAGKVNSEISRSGGLPGTKYRRSNPILFTYDIELELKSGEDDWDSGDTYATGDRLIYNERLYSSLQNGNLNKIPTDEPTWWRLTIYDYLEVIDAAVADDEFTKYKFKYLIQAGEHTWGSDFEEHNGFWLYESKLSFTFLNDNEPEYSTTSINTVNQTTINSNATSGFDLPEEDGFGVDDALVISKSAKDYIEDAWAASDINTLAPLDFQVTGADDFALTDDYTYKTFFQLLQDISAMLNATWWYDYTTDTVVVRSVDLLEDSEVIIQASDVLNWDSGQWSIDYDATVERSSAIVVGDNVIVSQDFTPDHNFDLGDEVEIIDDSSIQTPTQGRNLLTSIKPLHESPATTVRFTLDFADPDNDFAAVQRGKLITIQWPTTGSPTIGDFSGSEKLLVIDMEHNLNDETGNQEHVTIIAQKREQ
jgi:hypothetical protein